MTSDLIKCRLTSLGLHIIMSRSTPQKGVSTECSREEWQQWEKKRPYGKRDCKKKVSLLCNGPWTEWQMVPGEDCYSERSRHILYKGGRKAMPVLCYEEVVERPCEEVAVSKVTPGHRKQRPGTTRDIYHPVIAAESPIQTHKPNDIFRTTPPEHDNTVLSEGLAGGAVAGICLGVIFLIFLIALAVFLIVRRRQNKKSDYYSDPDIGDTNSSTRGNTYQEITSLDSTRSYERNIVLDSGKSPNDITHMQSADNHEYKHLHSPLSFRYLTLDTPGEKMSNNGCDQRNESNITISASKPRDNGCAISRNNTEYYSTILNGGDLDEEHCTNQTANKDSTLSEVTGNGSDVESSHNYHVLEKGITDTLPIMEETMSCQSNKDVHTDDRMYHILDPQIDAGAGDSVYGDNDYCSLAERVDADDPKYDVLIKAKVM